MKINISKIANLPSQFGNFKIQAFQEGIKEHLVIYKKPFGKIPLVRIHSECLTGDSLGSLKCDCGAQLEYSLSNISKLGGLVIYLRQEGRNIGLFNKVNAYSLQDKGLDTIEANHQLGFKMDERSYEITDTIFEYFQIDKIRLLTNNPKKINSLKSVKIIERCPIVMPSNKYNVDYLKTKKEIMGHMI
ncbi:MAG: GTP cyclohydrolase II [Arcobacter sp.]|nr:MAG: GTP cyclohydrolase II [Arcobacter sp.]